MAVCISLMFGRLGCVVGANIVALLLENHCEAVFYLNGSNLIGDWNNTRDKKIHLIIIAYEIFFAFVYSNWCINVFHTKYSQQKTWNIDSRYIIKSSPSAEEIKWCQILNSFIELCSSLIVNKSLTF